MKERVLITGANGFVGRRLYETLDSEDEYKVSNLDRNKHPFREVEFLREAVKGSAVIVHLAGLRSGTKEDLEEANTESTQNILQAFSSNELSTLLVFASSFAVYLVQSDVLCEDTETKPRNAYGESKLKAEHLIQKIVPNTKNFALILRFSTIFGPGSHSVVSGICSSAKRGEALNINHDGSQEVDLLYIDDAVDAIKKGLQWKGSPGQVEILNICSGRPVSINKISQTVEQIAKKPLERNYNRQVSADGYWIGDNSKAKKLLKWKPIVDLRKGIQTTYESA